MDLHGPVLVTGATGPQGGAVANALLEAKRPVRILVRNADAPAALAFADRGAEVIQGSLDGQEALENAMRGVDGVFAPIVPAGSGIRDVPVTSVNVTGCSGLFWGCRA